MDSSAHPSPVRDIAREIAGAMAWWQEAGVDQDFADEPAMWLAAAETAADKSGAPRANPANPAQQQSAPPVPVEKPRIGGIRSAWPDNLPGFHDWWRSEESLAAGTTLPRIAPRGEAGAELMIVVEQPEPEDRETLLSGPQGRYLEAIIDAMGLSMDKVYLASLLPHAAPMPDWQALGDAGLGEILAHHVVLAAPKRLLTFGSNIPSLLGNDLTQSSPNLHSFNHEGRTTPLLAERSLVALTRAKAKAGFWRRWLDWTGAQFA